MRPYYADEWATIYHGRCEDVLPGLPDGSVQMVMADLPYGTTANKWDTPIDMAFLWRELDRLCVPAAAMVFTASQPFTSALVLSHPDLFRHEWIWRKNRGSNFANTVREPMKEHESVLVFSRGGWTYNPIMEARQGGGADRVKYAVNFRTGSTNYGAIADQDGNNLPDERVPSSVQKWNTEVGLHPNQKPVPLGEYFIRTYSNPGDTILDPTGGSGTFTLAAKQTGRRAVMVEQSEADCRKAAVRLSQQLLDLGAA